MRLNATRLGSIASSRSFGDQLDDLAGQVPSLDLNFAQNKSLIDDYSGTTLATHTRASSGTFVGSDGVLRTAVTNLLLRSEEFDSASWPKNGTPTVTANSSVAPDGTTTAELFTRTTTGPSFIQQVLVKEASALTYTFSVYAKQSVGNFIALRTQGAYPARADVVFNLSTGAIASAASAVAGFASASATIAPLVNGWYRLTLTATTDAVTNLQVVASANSNGGQIDGTDSVSNSACYLWGAQLEQSSTVGEYIPTTSTINSAPRFDHNPTTGESLGLLVEEARTNSIRNNTMVGAVAGTPGTLPTNYSTSGFSGLTREIIGTGIINGVTYIDIKYSGTTTGTFGNLNFEVSTAIAGANGQIWAGSAWLQVVAGSLSGINSIAFSLQQRDSGGAYLADTTNGTVSAVLGTTFQRISRIHTTINASTAFVQPYLQFSLLNGVAIDFTLRIGLPQLEQGAFPTSVIPTTSAAATRAADVAQITGSNFGVTRTNLLVRSEEFDDASWGKTGSTVTANATTAPNGTLTADKIVEDSSNGTHLVSQFAPVASTSYVYSVYAKAGERTKLIFSGGGFAAQGFAATFNLSNGTLDTNTGSKASIVAVGDGWYRCIVSFTASNTTTMAWNLADASGSNSYLGNNTSGIYLWGAQLEVGSAVTPYIQSPSVFTSRASSGTYVGSNGLIQTATTNEARYDHDPVSLISRGLLLEEARTNLALDSEDFSAATWTRLGTTFTVNTVASPTGATTADTLLETATTTQHILYSTAPHTFTTATHSIYVKPNGRTNVALRFFNVDDDWVVTVFSLTGNGSVTQSSAGSLSGFSAVSRSIANAGNGWYRISMTATQTSRATFAAVLDLCTSSTPTLAAASGSEVYLGDVTKGVYAWGSQLEAASTASSYIPTTGSTVTRAADISTSVATSVFESSWYRQAEGTVFADAQLPPSQPTNFARLFSIDRGDVTANFIAAVVNNSFFRVDFSVFANSSAQAVGLNNGINASAGAFVKGAWVYKVNDFIGATGGVLTNSDSLGDLPTSLSTLGIGAQGNGTLPLNGTIRRLTYWPTRLGNEVLQRITQP